MVSRTASPRADPLRFYRSFLIVRFECRAIFKIQSGQPAALSFQLFAGLAIDVEITIRRAETSVVSSRLISFTLKAHCAVPSIATS